MQYYHPLAGTRRWKYLSDCIVDWNFEEKLLKFISNEGESKKS